MRALSSLTSPALFEMRALRAGSRLAPLWGKTNSTARTMSTSSTRIMSFNANGLRSAASKGFFPWFEAQNIDVLCLQETKAQEPQLDGEVFRPLGYQRYFKDASTKKGYSGVGIYSRREPDEVLTEIGVPVFDAEGRYLEARYGDLSVVSFYIPSGSSGELRQKFKYEMMAALDAIFVEWRKNSRRYILCGDWNIVHTELDIKNWKSNQKNSGCLPEERAWLDRLFQGRGWVDSFRKLDPTKVEYTWWSNRGAARANNVGWRIDYQIVSPELAPTLRQSSIHPEPRFSDHAPYVVEYDFTLERG